jgi:hypothetical protein
MKSTGALSLNHHIKTSLQLSPTPIFLHSTHHLHRHSSIGVDKYAHPLHVKVLKHFIYIQYECRMQSTGVWSLNHYITTSLRLSPTLIFLNSTPDLHRHYCIRVDPYAHVRVKPYAHPQQIKVLKHFIYVQYGCGMQSTGAWSLNHLITTSYRLSHTPIFLNSTPDLHMHYGIRVDPYAHPHQIKELKRFIYIQYGCGMQDKGA